MKTNQITIPSTQNHQTQSSFGTNGKQTKDAPVTLELKNLTKVFGSGQSQHMAVDQVNLVIRKGEFITLLGPSGCGKTTTLRLVAGFEQATSGQIILDGNTINDVPVNKRPMTMVFQSYALFPHMSVLENITYGLSVKKLYPMEKQKVELVMNLMNLVGLEDRMPHQISGGQQQRVALARALVMEPRVLLFDEPLSNLDAKLRIHMRTEIRRLQQRLGYTSLYVTHDQEEAMGLSDRIVVMNNGRIEQVGTPTEVYLRPKSVFVADFLGRSNFINSTVLEKTNDFVLVDFLGSSLHLSLPEHSFTTNQSIYLTIRPEAVQLSPNQEDIIHVQGEVKQVEYLGAQVEYEVEIQNGHIISIVGHGPQLPNDLHKVGEGITIYFPINSFHLLPQ